MLKKINEARVTIMVRSPKSMSPYLLPEKACRDMPPKSKSLGSSRMNRYTQMVRSTGFKSPNRPSNTGDVKSLKEYAIPRIEIIVILNVKLKLEPISCFVH
jgi:hypothetical protein